MFEQGSSLLSAMKIETPALGKPLGPVRSRTWVKHFVPYGLTR